MCESTAYFKGKEIMRNVARIIFDRDKVILLDIFGNKKEFIGNLKEANLLKHAIYFE